MNVHNFMTILFEIVQSGSTDQQADISISRRLKMFYLTLKPQKGTFKGKPMYVYTSNFFLKCLTSCYGIKLYITNQQEPIFNLLTANRSVSYSDSFSPCLAE